MEYTAIVKALEELGLEDKAATIYTTLLGKNRLGVAELARESGIKRATCYEYLDALLKKDFVIRVPVGKRMYYAAVNPRKILANYKKRTQDFENVLEELVHMHETATNKPKVSFFEGKREINTIYESLFKTMGETYSIFPPEAFFRNFTEADYDEFDKENSAHAIKTKDLFVQSKYTKRLWQLRKKNGYENKSDKVLPDWFSTNVDVLIFSDTVALVSLNDLSAVVIENKDIAELFKNMHAFIWKSL